MADRLAALMAHFPVNAQVFNTGALCGINTVEGDGTHGQLHLVSRGAVEVRYGKETLHVERPSLLLFPRPLTHHFVTDPVRVAVMVCASLSFEGGASNYRDGYQCPPVNWGINTDRKRGFFAKVAEVTGEGGHLRLVGVADEERRRAGEQRHHQDHAVMADLAQRQPGIAERAHRARRHCGPAGDEGTTVKCLRHSNPSS